MQLTRSRTVPLRTPSTEVLFLKQGVLVSLCRDLERSGLVLDPKSTLPLDYPRGAITATTPPTEVEEGAAGRQTRSILLLDLVASGQCDVAVDVLPGPLRAVPRGESIGRWLTFPVMAIVPAVAFFLLWRSRRWMTSLPGRLFQRFWLDGGPRHRRRQLARHRRDRARDRERYGPPPTA